MSSMYHPAQRALQDQFDARRLADRLEEVKVHAELTDADAAFITSRDMLFLATCDPSGQPTCSIKAGDPGFIRILDRRTLAFGWYDGNGMFLSAGNIAASPPVGLLLIDFEAGAASGSRVTRTSCRTPTPLQSIRARCSFSGSGCKGSIRTARDTSRSISSPNRPPSFRGRGRHRPCPIGSERTGRETCCRRRIRHTPSRAADDVATSRIVGFRADADGQWVAVLDCGHSQHMRHDPPWQSRPWVTTSEGRESFVGVEIRCTQCESTT